MGKVRRPHHDPLVRQVAAVLDRGEPTKFQFEGAIRAALRAHYCLEGREWHRADSYALQVLAFAFARLGVSRPTWAQGQPEVLERLWFCKNCGAPIEGRRRRFCGVHCRASFNSKRQRVEWQHNAEAARLVLATDGKRLCRSCGTEFEPAQNVAGRFCSRECYQKSRPQVERTCPTCGAGFTPTSRTHRHCCIECAHAARAVDEKHCELCGARYLPKVQWPSRFCSKHCQEQAYAARRREKGRKPVELRSCAQCGATFEPRKASQTYCATSCGQRARRAAQTPPSPSPSPSPKRVLWAQPERTEDA